MKLKHLLMCVVLTGCAGFQRDCSSCMATNTGADWIIVQYRFDGSPINCWEIRNVGVANEEHTDGIFWRDPATGHMVHISGWYSRVQVLNDDWVGAAKTLGIDDSRCKSGKYLDANGGNR